MKLYVCNKKKACNISPSCYRDCYHTGDITYALYDEHNEFDQMDDFEVEIIRGQEARDGRTDEHD